MSYSVQPYLINLEEVSAALGSKDAALLQAIISKHSDKSGDESEGGCVSLRTRLIC